MTATNQRRPLAFAGRLVKAELVGNVAGFVAQGVVTNLSNLPMIVDGDVPTIVPPWKSAILRGGTIAEAERVSVIDVPEPTNLGGVVFDGWDWFGSRQPKFPRQTPLYISPVDIVGEVELNPWRFANANSPHDVTAAYEIRLNLWYAPPNTDAVIHNAHAFLEIHTQIYGSGRIQIFHDEAGTRLYREITTAAGDTHNPIFQVNGLRDFRYPWHRGWTDTDAIWMAIELHPKT